MEKISYPRDFIKLKYNGVTSTEKIRKAVKQVASDVEINLKKGMFPTAAFDLNEDVFVYGLGDKQPDGNFLITIWVCKGYEFWSIKNHKIE